MLFKLLSILLIATTAFAGPDLRREKWDSKADAQQVFFVIDVESNQQNQNVELELGRKLGFESIAAHPRARQLGARNQPQPEQIHRPQI